MNDHPGAGGSTLLITGTSSGFGRGLAREMASRGHTVFATMRGVQGRNADAAEELLEWATRENLHLHVMELDVTRGATVTAAVGRSVEETGRLDAVVNNAGVGAFGPTETFTADQLTRILDVDVVGPHRVTRAALPALRRSGKAVVVYMSSAHGRVVSPFSAPYAAAKHALEGLAEAWSYELAPEGIDTVIVEPGGFATGFREKLTPGSDEERASEIPDLMERWQTLMGRFPREEAERRSGDPQVVVRAVAEVIEAPAGERPLRLPLGDDATGLLDRLNAVSREVQQMVTDAMERPS